MYAHTSTRRSILNSCLPLHKEAIFNSGRGNVGGWNSPESFRSCKKTSLSDPSQLRRPATIRELRPGPTHFLRMCRWSVPVSCTTLLAFESALYVDVTSPLEFYKKPPCALSELRRHVWFCCPGGDFSFCIAFPLGRLASSITI